MATCLVPAFVWREIRKRETRAKEDVFVLLEETNPYPVADAFAPLDRFLPLLLLVFFLNAPLGAGPLLLFVTREKSMTPSISLPFSTRR